MGKVIFWIVVIFLVLFALRMYNVAKSRKRPANRTASPIRYKPSSSNAPRVSASLR